MCAFFDNDAEMFPHVLTCRVGRRLFLDGDDGGVLLRRGPLTRTGSMQT